MMIEGLDIPRYMKSKQLFSARTRITTMAKLTASVSQSARRPLHRLR